MLLAAGADPTAQDELHYRTALHTAAMINDADLVKVALKGSICFLSQLHTCFFSHFLDFFFTWKFFLIFMTRSF